MGWIITGSLVAFLLFLLLCPVSLRIAYQEEELFLSAHYLFLRKKLIPPAETKKEKDETKEKEEEEKTKRSLSETLGGFWEAIQTGWGLAKSSKRALLLLKRHLVFYRIRAFALVGGDDAHSIGEEYGVHCALFTGSIGALSQFFYVKEPVLWVHPDFLAPKSEYDISARIRMRPLFAIGAVFLFLMQYLKQQSKDKPTVTPKKGGKKHEPKQSSE